MRRQTDPRFGAILAGNVRAPRALSSAVDGLVQCEAERAVVALGKERGFEVVAVYGHAACQGQLQVGEPAAEVLAVSLRGAPVDERK